jgi:hypothetical protein
VYSLHASATRQADWSTLGSQVDVEWKFSSQGGIDDETPEVLPLIVARPIAIVDELGRAPANTLFPLAFELRHQTGSAAEKLTDLKVEVSYDDGQRWTQVSVLRLGNTAFALLRHPKTPAVVSLRLHASDRAQNSLDQTMIRAYQTVLLGQSAKPQATASVDAH